VRRLPFCRHVLGADRVVNGAYTSGRLR
jgi:hypothetical protein